MNDIQGILDFQNLWEELCSQYYIKNKDIIFIDIESYNNKKENLNQYFNNIDIKNNNIVVDETIHRTYYENDKIYEQSYILENNLIRPDLIYKDKDIIYKDKDIIYIKDFKNWNMNNINIENKYIDIEKQEKYIDLFKSNKIDNKLLNERSIFIVPYYDNHNINTKLEYNNNIDIKNYNLIELNNILDKIKEENNKIKFIEINELNYIVKYSKNNNVNKNFKDLKENELNFCLKFDIDKLNAQNEIDRRKNIKINKKFKYSK